MLGFGSKNSMTKEERLEMRAHLVYLIENITHLESIADIHGQQSRVRAISFPERALLPRRTLATSRSVPAWSAKGEIAGLSDSELMHWNAEAQNYREELYLILEEKRRKVALGKIDEGMAELDQIEKKLQGEEISLEEILELRRSFDKVETLLGSGADEDLVPEGSAELLASLWNEAQRVSHSSEVRKMIVKEILVANFVGPSRNFSESLAEELLKTEVLASYPSGLRRIERGKYTRYDELFDNLVFSALKIRGPLLRIPAVFLGLEGWSEFKDATSLVGQPEAVIETASILFDDKSYETLEGAFKAARALEVD